MTAPDARLVQVALTGIRLEPRADEEVLARLQAKFKLTPEKAAAMLKGRCVVNRGTDVTSAQKLVAALGKMGLEAVIEEVRPPRATRVREAALQVAQVDASTEPPAAVNVAPSPPPPGTAPQAVPPRPQATPRSSQAPLEALLALADQRLPRPRSTFGYLAGLLLVTLLCVALPALYIGFTAAIACGWLWYLTHIHHHLPHNGKLVALMYVVPAFVGAVLVLFLIRPLFAKRRRPPEALKLDPEKESAFVAGVHALCRAIGVSPPIEIQLSWDANASVHFRTPWLSLFTGHKVLTIGMSLVGGLSARQFVGVLAHEFGHFAQRLGMTCTFTVNSINAWLEHCAYGEDALDRKLREWTGAAEDKEHWFSGIVNLTIAATWITIGLTRRLMGGLFVLSLRLSRYMSRQMEFDADRYEALLAGSDTFRRTARSLRALNHAFGEVNRSNIAAWQEHRLLDNLPEAVAAHASELDAARLQRIESEMREETTTRYWDSHPPDVERIDNAEKQNLPGIYRDESPATVLFKDFTRWSQHATRRFYAEQGVQFKEEQLRPVEEILGHARQRNQQREQINRFFNGQFQSWPLLQLRRPEMAADADEPSWQDCIDGIRARSPEIARNWLNALQAHESRHLLRAAVKLGANSRQLGLPGADRPAETLGAELENISAHRMDFFKPLDEGFSLYALRMINAVESMTGAEGNRAAQLRDTLASLGVLEREASLLDELGGAMRVVGSIAESSGETLPRFAELESNFGDCAAQLLSNADGIPQTVSDGGTVGAYLRACCKELPPAGTILESAQVARACRPLSAAFHRFYLLALGELVTLCEAAEKSRGIRPIRLVA